MAVGANLSYKSHMGIQRALRKVLLMRKSSRSFDMRKLCYKAGAPANNTAADNPNALHDICVDQTNNNAYICTLFSANASATTWVKINA